MKNCVYIIHSVELDKFNIGETSDFEKRFEEHKTGFYKTSFTSKTQDWVLFFMIECESKVQAIKIEKHIKNMKSKKYICNLKKHPEISRKLIEKY